MHSSYIAVGFMVTGVLTNLIYRYKTRSDGTIYVKDKYTYVRLSSSNNHAHSSQQFTLIDKDNNLYTIPYSVFSLQFNAEDKWAKVETNKKYHIKYWGIRMPLLGLYPRIDHISEATDPSRKEL